jgi:hypothetical protein
MIVILVNYTFQADYLFYSWARLLTLLEVKIIFTVHNQGCQFIQMVFII